jgi:hypothetical protein
MWLLDAFLLRRVVVERVAERHLFRRDLVTGVRDRCG